MRGFIVGVILVPVLVIAVLSIRPGGLRRQLHFAGRRLRIATALAGAYLVSASVLRLVFRSGDVNEFGPPVIAIILATIFLVMAQDPESGADAGS